MKVNNKNIIVTGAGNGIGREIVLNLLKKGAKVIAVDIREDYLMETKSLALDYKANLTTYVLNITDKSAVDEFAEKAITQHGSIDGLINNAGIIQPFVKVVNLDFEAIEKVMNINFYGTLYLIKAFLPHFLKRPEAHLVNISSMAGFIPVPGQSIYAASKAAVKLLSEALYSELLYTKVKVSVVFPGAIGTNISKNSGVEIQMNLDNQDTKESNSKIKVLEPSKAAEVIVRGIERNKILIFVGKDSKLMNLLYRLSPGFATRLISKQMKSLLKE